jgi:hypothetical protein
MDGGGAGGAGGDWIGAAWPGVGAGRRDRVARRDGVWWLAGARERLERLGSVAVAAGAVTGLAATVVTGAAGVGGAATAVGSAGGSAGAPPRRCGHQKSRPIAARTAAARPTLGQRIRCRMSFIAPVQGRGRAKLAPPQVPVGTPAL